MSTGSRVIAPSWLRGRKIEEGRLEVANDKTQVSIVGPLSAEQVAAPGSLGASPSLFIGSFATLKRPSTGPSARAGAVRNRLLRLRQHWRDLIGITDIEQPTFGNLARHLSRREVHDKQRLPAFNILWIWPHFFMPTRMERAWSPKSTRSRTSFSECATSSTARMAPTRTSILSRSEVEMRGLMGVGFMFHSLLRLGRSRRTRSHSSANRVHRDWPWRDDAWSRRGWESRDCRAPTASSGRPG